VFERLRAEAPVHYTAESEYGPYWVDHPLQRHHGGDTNHQVFSSETGITLQTLESKAENGQAPDAPELHLDGSPAR